MGGLEEECSVFYVWEEKEVYRGVNKQKTYKGSSHLATLCCVLMRKRKISIRKQTTQKKTSIEKGKGKINT